MSETVQQYKKRILGYLGGQQPLRILESTEKRLASLLRGVPRRQWQRRPAPKKWSVGEIVAHLAEVELVLGYRIRMMLSVNGTPIQAMDQNKWAVAGNYSRRDVRDSLELFRALRKANLSLLRSVPRKRWRQFGRHEERGKETVAETVRMYAGHDLNHLRQIESVLRDSRGKRR